MIKFLLLSVFVSQAAVASDLCGEVAGEKLNGHYKVIWKKDINSDGKEDVLLKTDLCHEGKCQAGVFLNCGQNKYVEVLRSDYGHSDLVVTNETSPMASKWSILQGPQIREEGAIINLANIDAKHDMNESVSKAREYQRLMIEKAYRRLKINSPEDFAGQYVFTGSEYKHFFTEAELNILMRLSQYGDPQASALLFFKVLKPEHQFPLYQKYQKQLSDMKNLRALFSSGMHAQLRDIPKHALDDAELRRAFARSNVAGMDAETLKSWIKQDPSLTREIVKYSADNIGALPEDLRKNLSLTELALAEHRSAIRFIDDSYYDNKDRIVSWCERFQISARYISDRLKQDRDVAKACVSARPINYEFFDRFKADREIARSALSRDGYMLAFAPESVKQDLDLVRMALSNYPAGKKYLSPEILSKIDTN